MNNLSPENKKRLLVFLAVITVILFVAVIKNSSNNDENLVSNSTISEETEPPYTETTDEPVASPEVTPEPKLVKLTASYDGSTKSGIRLDEDNEDISVTAEYDDGTTEDIYDYEIQNPTKLKAGKSSTINISYLDASCKLRVKCSSLSAKQYKKKCKWIPYKKLARTPDKYEGKKVKYTGKVIQVMESTYSNSYRIEVTKGSYGIWDDVVYVTYYGNSSKRILEDDIVTFYGKYDGLYSYESVLGASVTVPSVDAKYIVLNK